MLIAMMINYLMAMPGVDDVDYDLNDTGGHKLVPGGPDDTGDDGFGSGPGNPGV